MDPATTCTLQRQIMIHGASNQQHHTLYNNASPKSFKCGMEPSNTKYAV